MTTDRPLHLIRYRPFRQPEALQSSELREMQFPATVTPDSPGAMELERRQFRKALIGWDPITGTGVVHR